MNWFESTKNWFDRTKNTNWSETTKDILHKTKNWNWSESTKDLLESAKNVNWFNTTKNTKWYESARNLCETGKDLLGDVMGVVKENVEVRHLVIGGVALVLAVTVIRRYGSGGGASKGGKIMKAPGGNGRTMYREVFEGNPKDYFHDLRKK